MAVGLKDIAEDLNVSVSLVSKVLSGRLGTSGASEKLTQAIHERARTLGYRRNRTAAALTSGHHGVLGVFIHRVGAAGSGVAEELLRGIAQGATEYDQRLWLTFFEHDDEFRRLRNEIHPGEIDGLLFGGVAHSDVVPDLIECDRMGVKVVTIHNAPPDPALVNVGVNQEQLIRMATDHLLDLGCRRLAHIGAEPSRVRGFCQAHATRGMEPDTNLICYDFEHYEYTDGERAINHLLATGREFDGVVTQSDQQALAVLHVLMRRGINVPEQVKIIGVDNSPAAESSIVKLSSVSENYVERGRVAVQVLIDSINGKNVKSVDIKPSLHVRQSTLAQ